MRKVTAGLFSSLDGVVEAPDEWQPAFDEEMGAALQGMLDQQDAVLLGRVTFTEWSGYWPTSTDEPFAGWINNTPKYVASTTLDAVGQWPNSTLIKGPVADFVERTAPARRWDDRYGRQPIAGPVTDRGRTAGRAHLDDQSGRRWRRPQAPVRRRRRADQVRIGARPADQQRGADRHLPPNPVADQDREHGRRPQISYRHPGLWPRAAVTYTCRASPRVSLSGVGSSIWIA